MAMLGQREVGGMVYPTCSGPACGPVQLQFVNPQGQVIDITDASDGSYFLMQRRGGYANNEQATITIKGPGTVTFDFFNVETGWDKLIIAGTTFTGYALPAPFEVPAGTHTMEWSSDGSVGREGWTLEIRNP